MEESFIARLKPGDHRLFGGRLLELVRVRVHEFMGFPDAPKSTRQLQASSSLFYDVFRKYDPDNLLLTQAQQEVLRQELDVDRLSATLARLQTRKLDLQAIQRPTPFAFALMVEHFRESLSSEKLTDRIARMVKELEQGAGMGAYAPAQSGAEGASFNSAAARACPAHTCWRRGPYADTPPAPEARLLNREYALEIAGTRLLLLAAKALYWPEG